MAVADASRPFQRTERAMVAAVAFLTVCHLVLLVVFPAEPTLLELTAAEGGIGIVVSALLGWADSLQTAALFGVLWLPFVGGAVALTLVVESLLTVAFVVTGVFALLAYGLHRYELVAMGLVEADDE